METSSVIKQYESNDTNPIRSVLLSKEETDTTKSMIMKKMKLFAQNTIGPQGKRKMIKLGLGYDAEIVCSCKSKVIFENMMVNHPIASILLQTSKGVREEQGDYGLLTTFLTSTLVLKAQEVSKKYSRMVVTEAFPVFKETVLRVLEELKEKWGKPCTFGQMKPLISLLCTILSTSSIIHQAYTTVEIKQLAAVIYRAFIESLPKNMEEGIPKPPIQFISFQNHQECRVPKATDLFFLEKNTYYLPYFMSYGLQMEDKVYSGKCLVYEFPLQPETLHYNRDHLLQNKVDEQSTFRVEMMQQDVKDDFQLMDDIIERWEKQHIQFVFSQKTVHDYIKIECKLRGILIIERLSLLHIKQVAEITNSTILAEVTMDIEQSVMGYISKSTLETLSTSSYLRIEGIQPKPTNPSYITLFIKEKSMFVKEEIEEAIMQSFQVLLQFCKEPILVPAGGYIEAFLSQKTHYHRQSSHMTSVLTQLATAFGDVTALSFPEDYDSFDRQQLLLHIQSTQQLSNKTFKGINSLHDHDDTLKLDTLCSLQQESDEDLLCLFSSLVVYIEQSIQTAEMIFQLDGLFVK